MDSPISKDIRRAMMTARGIAREPLAAGGGSTNPDANVVRPYQPLANPYALKQAIRDFSQRRAAHFEPRQSMSEPSVAPGQMSRVQLRAEPPMPPPRPQGLSQGINDASDLGKTIETGADMLAGKPSPIANERPTIYGHMDPLATGDPGIGNVKLREPGKESTAPENNNPVDTRSGYKYFGLNNPGNIGYSSWTQKQGGAPSQAHDTGHLIASFPDLETGYNAMANLARNKYNLGSTSLNKLIAGKDGWTPGNYIAAKNIGKIIGVSPDEDLNLNDNASMANFQRALTIQETGSSSQWDKYNARPPVDARKEQTRSPVTPISDPSSAPVQGQSQYDAPDMVAPQSLPDQPFHTSALGPAEQQQAPMPSPPPQPQQAPPQQAPPQDNPPPDQFSNLYNKVAFGPSVASGYDNFDVALAPDDQAPVAKRGGKIIDKAMSIARKARAFGGQNTASWGGQPTMAGGNPVHSIYPPNFTAAYLSSLSPPPSPPPSVVNSPYTPPPPPQTYTPTNTSSITPQPQYQNTLDQVLGTNNPTMQEEFGFNYPNIPPPQPNIYEQPEATTLPGGSYTSPSTGSSGSATDTINQGSFLPGATANNPALAAYGFAATGNSPPALAAYGFAATGNSPLLTNPAPLQTINGVPSIMPPLVASGTVGNYSNFNPSGLSSNQVPMATPWGGNIGMPLASARGGHIMHNALRIAHKANSRRKSRV